MTAPDDHRRQLEVYFRPNLFSEITSLIVSSKPQKERKKEITLKGKHKEKEKAIVRFRTGMMKNHHEYNKHYFHRKPQPPSSYHVGKYALGDD